MKPQHLFGSTIAALPGVQCCRVQAAPFWR
jgi:hypothetical protein